MTGATTLTGAATISSTLTVADATTLNNGLTVTGNTRTGTLSATSDASVGGNLSVTGNTNTGTLSSTRTDAGILSAGNTSITGTLSTTGVASIGDNLTVANNTRTGTLSVTGATTLNGDLLVKGRNLYDSVMKYDTSKVNVIDTAAMLEKYARRFTRNVKLNLAPGRTLGKYNVGDSVYVKGKTLDEFLYDMTNVPIPATYTAPTAGVSSNKLNSYEIGTDMTSLGPINLSYSYIQNDGGDMVVNSEVFYRNGTTLGAGVSSDVNAGTLSGTNRYLTSTISYTVNVSYGAGPVKNDNLGAPSPAGRIGASNVTSTAITITPYQNIYWGVATNPLAINYLQNPAKSNVGKSKNFSMSGLVNQHIFYAYPFELGALSLISIGGFYSKDAFTETIINLTNASGYTAQYYLYVSKEYFNGSVNNIIYQ